MKPGELQARDEIADIDELCKQAGETIKTLQQRRREILGLAEATPRLTASLLHVMECRARHQAGGDCPWWSGTGTAWTMNPRAQWVQTARGRVERSGEAEDDFLQALRTIASSDQLEKSKSDFEEPEDGASW